MSYTPPEQEIEKPLSEALQGLESLRSAMLARLRSPDWSDSHKEDLRSAVLAISALQVTLARFE